MSKVSLEVVDGELVQVKAELLKVRDMLKIRDTELEELQSARHQVRPANLTEIWLVLVN